MFHWLWLCYVGMYVTVGLCSILCPLSSFSFFLTCLVAIIFWWIKMYILCLTWISVLAFIVLYLCSVLRYVCVDLLISFCLHLLYWYRAAVRAIGSCTSCVRLCIWCVHVCGIERINRLTYYYYLHASWPAHRHRSAWQLIDTRRNSFIHSSFITPSGRSNMNE